MDLDTTGCAPLRLSLGWSTTDEEIDIALRVTLKQWHNSPGRRHE